MVRLIFQSQVRRIRVLRQLYQRDWSRPLGGCGTPNTTPTLIPTTIRISASTSAITLVLKTRQLTWQAWQDYLTHPLFRRIHP